MRLLVELGFFQALIRVAVIGHGVLPVLVEEQQADPARVGALYAELVAAHVEATLGTLLKYREDQDRVRDLVQ